MFIIFIRNNYKPSEPTFFMKELLNIVFTFTSFLDTNNCSKVVQGRCLMWQRCRSRVLKQKFFNPFSNTIQTKLSFISLVAWGEENDSATLRNLMFLSKTLSDPVNCSLKVSSKELLVHIEWLLFQKTFEIFTLLIDVPYCIVDPVLTCILSWEIETIARAKYQRYRVMNKVKVLKSPLFVILNEFVVEMLSWHFIAAVKIELYSLLYSS